MSAGVGNGPPGSEDFGSAAEALRAFDPPGGCPRLLCDVPAADARPSVGDQLVVSGWALSRSESGRVSVYVDAGRRVPVRQGLYRPDVAATLGDPPGARWSGWTVRFTTRGLGRGEQPLTITARDEQGRETSVRRAVEIDPWRGYAAQLASREPFRPRANAGGLRDVTAVRLAVCVVIRDDSGEDDLARTVQSLEQQSHPAWQLGTARSPEELASGVRQFLESDADYLVLAEAGDLLAPHALAALADQAILDGAPDAIYADEDVLGRDGDRIDPFFKPGWSPELLLAMDYVGPFLALGKVAARRAIEIDSKLPASAHELLLRLVDERLTIRRIPDVLYTRPRPPEDLADRGEDVREALRGVGHRRGRSMEVVPLAFPGAREIAWKLDDAPKVSIVIGGRREKVPTLRCMRSLHDRDSYPTKEVLIVNPSDNPLPSETSSGLDVQVVSYDGPFNSSAINNAGAAAATGEYLLFLDGATEVLTPDWIERLLREVQQPGVGVAGPKLLYPEGAIRSGGVMLVEDERGAEVLGAGFAHDDAGYRGALTVARNQSSVSGACMLIGRDLFLQLGGFDDAFSAELSDVDLCLRSIDSGRRVVWTPHAQLGHFEQRDLRHHQRSSDRSRFIQRWSGLLEGGDPYYNPQLSSAPGSDYAILDPSTVRVMLVELASAGEDKEETADEESIERFVPELHQGLIHAEHTARYLWASRAVAGKEVLDAGCGVGWGTKLLADAGASRAVGIDLSAEAVEDAIFRAGALAEFAVGDLRSLPFASQSFDVVVCFEAIEHVDRGEVVLDEIKRVLRHDGVLLLSSPNRNVYPPFNPHHVHEFTTAELETALRLRFENVVIYRQQPLFTSLLIDDAGFASKSSTRDVAASMRKIAGGTPGDELYSVAVAGNSALPELGGIAVLADPVDFRALTGELVRLTGVADAAERKAALLEEQVALLSDEASMLRNGLATVEASASWRVTSPLRWSMAQLRELRRRPSS